MQGSFWYLALLVIGSIIVAITYWKSRNKHTFTLWFGMTGICYLIEASIHTMLHAYEYFPRFLPDKYADSVLGAFISDLFVLPSAAVLIGVFQLGWGWIIAISGIIAGIEELFLKLGIYKNYWWKTSYTFITIMLLFFLAKGWYRRLNRPHGRGLTFITMLSILYAFSLQLHLHITLHLKSGQYTIKWLEALGVNSSIITTPINVLFAFSLAILILYRVRWFWIAALIAGFTGMDLLLYMLNVLHPRSYWLFVLLLLARVIVLLVGLAFDKLLRKNEVLSESGIRKRGNCFK
jgi:hypothetical protein